MDRCRALVLLALLALPASAAGAPAGDPPALRSEKDKVSYAVGVDVARNFRRQEIDIDPDLLLAGMKDTLSGGRLLLGEKELRKITRGFQAEVRRKIVLSQRATAAENLKKEAAFLEANRREEGVVELPGGVQYRVLEEGRGKVPAATDTVECRYRGTLLDGTEYDGTEPERTAELKLSTMVPGWKAAVARMPAGSRWRIFIPSRLGYGERGVGSEIGPNELLVVEMELVRVL